MNAEQSNRALAWYRLQMAAMTMGRDFSLSVGSDGITVKRTGGEREVSQTITWNEMKVSHENPLTRAMGNMIHAE